MGIKSSPLTESILFALFCGLAFTPVVMGFSLPFPPPIAFRLTIWLFAALYGLVMTRRQAKRLGALFFPLITLLFAVAWVNSSTGFMMLTIGLLGWVRSAFGTGESRGNWGAELIVDAASIAWLSYFQPQTLILWPLSVCGFFLIQAAYYILLDHREDKIAADAVDPFERARRNAEKIVDD